MYLIYPMQWEALQYPEWTDAQLGQWQTEWEQVRFIAPRSTELRLNIAMISNQYTKLRGSIRDLIGLTKHAITGWNMSSKSMWDFIKAEPVSAA